MIATSLIALAAGALAAAPSGHLPVVRIDAPRPVADEPKVAARLRASLACRIAWLDRLTRPNR